MDATKLEYLKEGVIILCVGITIVFVALCLLYLVFQFIIPSILSLSLKRPTPAATVRSVPSPNSPGEQTGEAMAAIATAVALFLDETHDEENPVVTISKSVKDYSPWSSKIYVTHHNAPAASPRR